MPKFIVTAPDGTKYPITGPEGATEADAIAEVQRQLRARSTPAAQPKAPDSQVAPTPIAAPSPMPGAPAARKIVPEEPSEEKVNVGAVIPFSTKLGQKRRIERGPSVSGPDPEEGFLRPFVKGSDVITGKKPVSSLTPGDVLEMAAVGAHVSRPVGAVARAAEAPKPLAETVKQVSRETPRETPLAGPEEVKPPVTSGPMLDPPPEAETTKGLSVRIADGLHRTQTNASADKVEAAQFLQGLDRPTLDPAFQAKVYSEIEQRMADPAAKLSPDVANFVETHLKPWKSEENTLASNLKRRLGKDATLMDLPGYEQGYVHRIVQGKGQYFDRLDPERSRQFDPVMGTGRTLSKRASSLQPREFFVFDSPQGRAWLGRPPEGKSWSVGQTRRASDGTQGTLKLATTAEIESHTPVRYFKNATINTVENVLRLRRVTRNLDLLETLKPQLEQRGLFRARSSNEPMPEGWKRVTLPQLEGFADPRIANVLNDFHGEIMRGGDLAQLGAKINRFLVGSLFFTPFPHAANVMNHWIIGRGFDWLRPSGWHSVAVDGARAMKAVVMKDENYIRMLREGSALINADVGNANFYKLMLEKMSGEILRDPQTWTGVARNLGFRTPIDMVRMIYRTSSKMLWGANDVFMLQRQFELMRKGVPVRQAIFEAEKDIPNYRIPSEVMGLRWTSELLQNPNLTMFGRYHYGLWRALSTMITDIVRPMEGGQRKEAIGKLLVLGLLAFGAYPLASRAVKKITGNPDADVQRYGPLGPLQATYELTQGQRDWMAAVSAIMSPSPVIRGVGEAATNRDVFGREIINPQSTPLGMATQAGEAVAGQIAPLQQAMTAAKPGGTAQVLARNVGVKLPSPGAKAGKMKGKAIEKRQAARREGKDPIEQRIKGLLRDFGVGHQ